MMRKVISLAVAMLVLVAAPSLVLAKETIPQHDDFEGYALGTMFTSSATPPPGFSNDWGDSATYLAGYRYDIVETAELDGNPNNQVARVVDIPQSSTDTKNTHFRTNLYPSPWPNTGIYYVSMDVKPLQTDGPFKIVMTNGSGWTSGFNWVAALAFGSTAGNTFFPGMTTGNHLGLETTTTAWVDSSIVYSANTWYTVQFNIDIDNRLYQAFFGEHGGALTEVTSGWSPWITGATTPPTTWGGLYFATSNKAGEGAQLLVDNVIVTPEPTSLVALGMGAAGLLVARRKRAK